jgi:hypothetical protein
MEIISTDGSTDLSNIRRHLPDQARWIFGHRILIVIAMIIVLLSPFFISLS